MIGDILIIALMLFCILQGYSKGFASSSVNFVASIGSLIASYFASVYTATLIFDRFLQERIVNTVYASLNTLTSEVDITVVANEFMKNTNTEFLRFFIEPALQNADMQSIMPTLEGVNLFTDTVIQPVIETFMAIILFIIFFIILRIILKAIVESLKIVNKIPVIGAFNKLFGLAIGCVIGAINSVLAIFVIFVLATLFDFTFLKTNFIEGSYIINAVMTFITTAI